MVTGASIGSLDSRPFQSKRTISGMAKAGWVVSKTEECLPGRQDGFAHLFQAKPPMVDALLKLNGSV
jgi:hypothetical protein